ncbi:hypothetical protein [Pectobacterium parvum]|uniref:hypothetical protein n=1 Tax=Pectobacterium parvum TaxID=2778550 RepID=UPI0015F26302|nr:hypothetical protein [Pectobacterium parvum]
MSEINLSNASAASVPITVEAEVHHPMNYEPSIQNCVSGVTNSPGDEFKTNQKESVLSLTIDDLSTERNKNNFLKILDSIKSHNSPAAEAFKEHPNETNKAFQAFNDIACRTIPHELAEKQLNKEGEAIKRLLAALQPHIPEGKDKKIFNDIVKTLSKGNAKKEYNVDKKLSKLWNDYGKDALNHIATQYYKLCTEAWERKNPLIERSHENIFTEQVERFYSIVKEDVAKLTDQKNDWRAMDNYFSFFRDDTVSLCKALRYNPTESRPQKDRAFNPEPPAAKLPDATPGAQMQGNGWGGGVPIININGGNASISGNNSSSSRDNNHPGLVNNRGMDWNAALDSVLTKGDLTKEDRVNLLDDIIKAASSHAFIKESGGVLPNLQSVSAYTPDNSLQQHGQGAPNSMNPPQQHGQGAPNSMNPPQQHGQGAPNSMNPPPPPLPPEYNYNYGPDLKNEVITQYGAVIQEMKKKFAENEKQERDPLSSQTERNKQERTTMPHSEEKGADQNTEDMFRTTAYPASFVSQEDGGEGDDTGTYRQQGSAASVIPTPPPPEKSASSTSLNGAWNEPKTSSATHIAQTDKVTEDSRTGDMAHQQQKSSPQGIPTPPPPPPEKSASSTSLNGARNEPKTPITNKALSEELLNEIRKGRQLKPIAGTTASLANEAMNEPKTSSATHIAQTDKVTGDLGAGDIAHQQQKSSPQGIPTPPPPPPEKSASSTSLNGARNEPKTPITNKALSEELLNEIRKGRQLKPIAGTTASLANEAMNEPKTSSATHIAQTDKVTEDLGAGDIAHQQQKSSPQGIPTPPPPPPEKSASSTSLNGARNANAKDVTDSASKVKPKPMFTPFHTKVKKRMPSTNGSTSPAIDQSSQLLRKAQSLPSLNSQTRSASVYTTNRTPDVFNRRQSKEPLHFNRVDVKRDLSRSFSWSSLNDKRRQEPEDKLEKSTMNS